MKVLYGLLAGTAASLFSFSINTRLIGRYGDRALFWYIPLVEEFSKTCFAFFLSGDLVFSHMAFGTIEALYDLFNTPEKYSFTASVLSLLSHTVFGLISFFTVKLSGSPVPAVLLAVAVHGLWNRFIAG